MINIGLLMAIVIKVLKLSSHKRLRLLDCYLFFLLFIFNKINNKEILKLKN